MAILVGFLIVPQVVAVQQQALIPSSVAIPGLMVPGMAVPGNADPGFGH